MNCQDRYLACHDKCDRYKDWKEYSADIRRKQKSEKYSYRSYATNKKTMKDKKKNSASYMRNKF